MPENSLSLAYIAEMMDELRSYAGQTIVVKIGGNSIAEDPEFLTKIARQFEFLQCRRIGIVLVHGGGPQIDTALQEAGLALTKGSDGRRVTDPAIMNVVARVMGDISLMVAEALEQNGCPVYCAARENHCLVHAEPLQGAAQDIAADRTGLPSAVDAFAIQTQLRKKKIVILNSVGRGPDHGAFNINADDYAMAVATALGSRRLILATNVAGVYDAEKQPISSLTPDKARALIANGVIARGMIPKVESALRALGSGVGGVVIVDAHKEWALLGEILTHAGFGTLIAAEGSQEPAPSIFL